MLPSVSLSELSPSVRLSIPSFSSKVSACRLTTSLPYPALGRAGIAETNELGVISVSVCKTVFALSTFSSLTRNCKIFFHDILVYVKMCHYAYPYLDALQVSVNVDFFSFWPMFDIRPF